MQKGEARASESTALGRPVFCQGVAQRIRARRRRATRHTICKRNSFAGPKIVSMSLVTRCAVLLAAAPIAVQLAVQPAFANRDSEALRVRGAVELYNMDRERALETYRQAIAADPEDAAAYRGLASAWWLSITF